MVNYVRYILSFILIFNDQLRKIYFVSHSDNDEDCDYDIMMMKAMTMIQFGGVFKC